MTEQPTYRVGSFPHLTAQDVVDLIGWRVMKLTKREHEILPDRLDYLELATFYYGVKELIENRKEGS